MSRKIGILTFHHVINEGAVLQAYSLARILSARFPDSRVEIVDYRCLTAEKRYFQHIFLRRRSLQSYIIEGRRFFKIRSFIRSELPLSPQNLTSDDYQEAVRFVQKQGYDTIFVGSDEIWKKGDGFIVRPFPNIYWLSGAITARKIAISASANKLVPRDLSPNEIDWVTERLRDFAFIGVRDRHTFDLVSALAPECGERLYRMYDPTFALEVGKPDKEWYRRRGVRFDRKIAGITFCDPRINDILVDALKMRGYQVVALSWYNARADVNLAGELSPLGWAETFHIFDLCLTNLFHGTVFSIKAGRPFISFDSFHGLGFETKMESLLKDMGLMRHYWPQESFLKYPALIEEKIDEVLSGSGSSPYAEAVKTGQASLQSFLDKVKDLV